MSSSWFHLKSMNFRTVRSMTGINIAVHVHVTFDFMDVVTSIWPHEFPRSMTSALHALVYNNPSISADGLYIMLTRSHNLCFPLIHLFLEIISVIQLANDELINLIYFACKNEGMRMRQIPSANLLQLLSFFCRPSNSSFLTEAVKPLSWIIVLFIYLRLYWSRWSVSISYRIYAPEG